MEPQEFIIDEVCNNESLVFGDEEAEVVGGLLMFSLHGLIFLVVWVVLGPEEQVFLAKTNKSRNLRHMDQSLITVLVSRRNRDILIEIINESILRELDGINEIFFFDVLNELEGI